MKDQIKHFLQLKATLIGAIGLKMLFAKAVLFQLLAAKAVLAEAAVLAVVSASPVFAQSPAVIFATDAEGNLVTVEKGITEELPPPLPSNKKFAVKPVAEQIKEHMAAQPVNAGNGNGAVGKTSLSGVPMTAEQQKQYLAQREERKKAEATEKASLGVAVGRTSLAGVMTAEEEAEYKKLQEELKAIAAQNVISNSSAVGKTSLAGVAE